MITVQPLEAGRGGSFDPSATLIRAAVDLNVRKKGPSKHEAVKGHRVAFHRYQLSPLKKIVRSSAYLIKTLCNAKERTRCLNELEL